jgi:preprotein translocase subunit SecF
MNCSKCGSQNAIGERFCKNCGCLLENNVQQQTQSSNQQFMGQNPEQNVAQNQMNGNVSQQPVYNNMYNGQNNNNTQQGNYGNLSQNYVNNAVNPNMKKWAVLSIIVPSVAIIWYIFIGLSFYLAVLIAAAGFGFAQKGEMADKKLATIGKVLNGILFGMACVMLVITLISTFMS